MKRVILTIAALVAALSIISTAAAGTAARDPRVPALQRQVASLSAHVAALQSQVDKNAQVLNYQIDLNTCQFVYQSHFNYGVLNILSAMIGGSGYPDNTGSDNGACSRVGISPPRFLASVQRSPFTPLVALLAAVTR